MAKEIERKFLVKDSSFLTLYTSKSDICQGYVSRKAEGTVRVRVKDDSAYITVKGKNRGMSRSEWEFEIPVEDARLMLLECCEGSIIRKTRYVIPFSDLTWEVDEFHGTNEGLIIAEVELESEDTPVVLPPFVGKEVTGDPRYYNSNL